MKTQVKSLKVPYNTPKHKKNLVTETVNGKELLTQIYDSYQAEPFAEQRKLLYRALHLIKLNPENVDWKKADTLRYIKANGFHPANIYVQLGYYYQRLKNYETAVRWYLKAQQYPKLSAYYTTDLKIAECLDDLNEKCKALNYYHRHLSQNPADEEVHHTVAKLYYEIKDYAQACTHFHKAVKLMARFKNIPARVALVYTDWAKVYMQNKKYAEAREKLLMALRHHITNANALRHLAYCLSFEPCKDVETEESIYWQLVNSSEAMHTDWHNLSVIFQYERNDFKNAQQGYLQALELLEKCELTKAHPEKYHEARYKTWRNLSIVCHALQDHAGFSKWVMLIAANYSRKAKRDTFFMYH